MARANQGGSIPGYVVVGVILALLLVSGVYSIRQQVSMPSVHHTNKPTSQSSSSKSASQTTPAPSGQSSATSQAASSPQPTSSSSQLPHTGPTEVFDSLIALCLLSGVFVSYYRSRRPELSL
jgi:cytoskeletal protein RodZ